MSQSVDPEPRGKIQIPTLAKTYTLYQNFVICFTLLFCFFVLQPQLKFATVLQNPLIFARCSSSNQVWTKHQSSTLLRYEVELSNLDNMTHVDCVSDFNWLVYLFVLASERDKPACMRIRNLLMSVIGRSFIASGVGLHLKLI